MEEGFTAQGCVYEFGVEIGGVTDWASIGSGLGGALQNASFTLPPIVCPLWEVKKCGRVICRQKVEITFTSSELAQCFSF